MSELIHGRDAAFPENLMGYTGVILGYTGGARAFNPWTLPQWELFTENEKIPIWVAGNGPGSESLDSLAMLKRLDVPKGCVTLLDMEARIDKYYVAHYGEVLQDAGYKVWVYGSTSTVFDNPQLNGYAVADPTGGAHMYPHPGVRMTQCAFGAKYDHDVIREWVLDQDELWR